MPKWKYFNEVLNQVIEIINDPFLTPDGGRKRLFPKSDTVFYLSDIPVLIRFDDSTIIIEGEQLCDKWTTIGTIFNKLLETSNN